MLTLVCLSGLLLKLYLFPAIHQSFQSRKRLYNHKCLFVRLSVRPSVCKTPQQLEIIILHPSSFFIHPSSYFIILHSSFLHFATFKLFSLFLWC